MRQREGEDKEEVKKEVRKKREKKKEKKKEEKAEEEKEEGRKVASEPFQIRKNFFLSSIVYLSGLDVFEQKFLLQKKKRKGKRDFF